MERSMQLFCCSLLITAAAATAAVSGRAGTAIRAANALFADFFGFPDKPSGKTQDQKDHCNNDIINRIHNLLLSAKSVFGF
jgi:hypothetical protein